MRLQVEIGDRSRPVALSIASADATIGDLADALGLEATSALSIDGQLHSADTLLESVPIVDGSTVRTSEGSAAHPGLGANWVGVIGGPDAGSIARVGEQGNVSIGRNGDQLNDHALRIDNNTVSGRHARIELHEGAGISVRDLDSHNGTWIGERQVTTRGDVLDPDTPLRAGSSRLVVRRVDTQDRPLGAAPEHAGDNGRVLFNRPPRLALPPEPAPIRLPDPVADRQKPKLPLVTMIVPILFAVVMVTVTGRIFFAIFALLSPVMAIGNYISGRRRVTKERKEDAITNGEALERLELGLDQAVLAERLRRRAIGPDMVEVRRRIEVPSSRLWERRFDRDDALMVRIGLGAMPWTAPVDPDGPAADEVAADVSEVLDHYSSIEDIELLTDLREGVLGVYGDPDRSRAVLRAIILQLAASHGPADIRIAILTTPEDAKAWEWSHWLPHTNQGDGSVMVLADANARRFGDSLFEQLPESSGIGKSPTLSPRWVFIVDDVTLVHERSSSLRRLLEHKDSGIYGVVRADRTDQLPATTTYLLEVGGLDGECRFGGVDTADDERAKGLVDSVSVPVAEDMARGLARFEDPEVDEIAGGLPERASIHDILVPPDADAIDKAWKVSAKGHALLAPLGLDAGGTFTIDMITDGPHGLVAGTTGAGKSELLRTFVIGAASKHSPDDLVFVLVDYKGGSAFDVCTDLPHVVGIVTDLDDHLARRALRSLDAEVHRRELLFRDAGTKDISDYRDAGSPAGPVPRLIVIVDEFATLKTELPDFVSALVSVAQRGRSLGIHMILATQRPSGAVDANIRANTNLRIALRVQDAGDSQDVIDVKTAAELPRSLPGRAFVRRGQGDLTPVQTAYASGRTASDDGPRVSVEPIGGDSSPSTDDSAPADEDAPTDLALYVAACTEAASRYEPPRRPWIDPLPDVIGSEEVAGIGELVSPGGEPIDLAIGDDPEHQRWIRLGWDPALGHLGVIGALGSGVTTTIRSVVACLGRVDLGRDVWVYAADHGARGLAGLDVYEHVAPVIDADDSARHQRLFSLLSAWIDERSQMPPDEVDSQPLVIVAVDGIAGFTARNDLSGGTPAEEEFGRIVRDGPALGISLLVGAGAVKELPRVLRGAFKTTVVHEQMDPNDYTNFSLRERDLPTFGPGRVILGDQKSVAQIIDWSALLDAADMESNAPMSIDPLPERVDPTELGPAVVDGGLVIPVGIENQTRGDSVLRIRAGEHATISGPSQSGRTSTLKLIASKLRAADDSIRIVGLGAGDLSAFDPEVVDAAGTLDDLRTVLEHAQDDDENRWVILVDDADRIDADSGPLAELARSAPPNVTIIAAVRTTAARSAFGHWTRQVRASGVGLLLQPDNSTDGEIFGNRLPRGERLPPRPGRGYVVQSSEIADTQIAH